MFTNPKRQFRTASRQKIAELIKRTHVEPLEKKEKKIERERTLSAGPSEMGPILPFRIFAGVYKKHSPS